MALGVLSKSISESSLTKGEDSVLADSFGHKSSKQIKCPISPIVLLEVRVKMSRLWYIFQYISYCYHTHFMHLVMFPSFWRSKDRPRRKSWTLLHEERNIENIFTLQGSIKAYAFASNSDRKIVLPMASGRFYLVFILWEARCSSRLALKLTENLATTQEVLSFVCRFPWHFNAHEDLQDT